MARYLVHSLRALSRPLPPILLAIIWCVAWVSTPTPADAQTPPPPPPTYLSLDQNGVNLLDASFTFNEQPLVSIGQPGAGGLSYSRRYDGVVLGLGTWRDNASGNISISEIGSLQGAVTTYIVSFRGSASKFTKTGAGPIIQAEGFGGSLAYSSGTDTYTFTTAEGAVVTYPHNGCGQFFPTAGSGYCPSFAAYPSGETLSFTYRTFGSVTRLQSVNNNFGYQLKLEYENDDPNTGAGALVRVRAINNAIDYCDPAASTCTGLTQAWPTATFTGMPFPPAGVQTVTDSLGRVTRYTFTSGLLTGIRRPSSSVDNITITYLSTYVGRVVAISNGAGTWTYSFGGTQGSITVTVTDPQSHQTVTTNDGVRVTSTRDALNRTTSYAYDTLKRLTRITRPEGDFTEYVYDARGNVTQVTRAAKPGSGLANIVVRATYPSSCAGLLPAVCNRPTATFDERNFQTDYTYDPVHGGLATVTAPAPGAGAARPQTRYTYTDQFAWYKNSAGVIVQGPSPLHLLAQTSACVTGATCAGAATERIESVTFGTPGVANNLLPTSITQRAGDNSASSTRTMTYDTLGDPLLIDGPLPGTDDTTRFRRDAARQLIGMVGPDPYGAGALKHRATRITYNADGQIESTEEGAVNSQSDADWAAFTSLERTSTTYDSQGRQIRQDIVAGGATRAVTQFSYDTANRLTCTATRMNPAVYGSLPASACSLGSEGAFGPDRITRNTYDAADQLVAFESAVGTSLQQFAQTLSYTANGRRAWLEDANGNRTSYTRDGFDRVVRVNFPQPATGSHASNPSDFEELTYDAASNLAQERLRDGQLTTYGYDNLDRRITVNAPGVPDDVTYSFDNLGRMTGATSSTQSISMTVDALGRLTSEAGPLGQVSYQYDAANRRTRMTWPDAFFVTYDYDLQDEVTAIRENGAVSGIGVLITYAYDDLGRRASITRGNGTVSTFSYGADAELSSMTQDVAGAGDDQTLTLAYNPAAELATRTMANDAYAWPQPPSGSEPYTSNGLNQATSVGGSAITRDARGNHTTTGGGTTYQFDISNRLISSSAGATFAHDPTGRLFEASASGVSTRFLYDETDLIAEYNGSTLLRRYVHGPGEDEPLVWYEGSGASDRRWLHADQIGSIIAITNTSGAAIAINTYDEYGQPGPSNQGRFQFTGQVWLAEVGLHHFKARTYSASLGRFLQPDPTLYEDGMHLYAYVGNDPVSATDPTGLACINADFLCTESPNPAGDEIVVTGMRGSDFSFEGLGFGPIIAGIGQVAQPIQLAISL